MKKSSKTVGTLLSCTYHRRNLIERFRDACRAFYREMTRFDRPILEITFDLSKKSRSWQTREMFNRNKGKND